MRLDWGDRRRALEEILSRARSENIDKPYDCLVPISGGKDSLFQLHVLVKEFGMRPLAATFSHNWFSATGMFNLFNALERLDVDHIMFTPRRSQVNALARLSLGAIGDACWHCHAGVGAFPLTVARNYGIRLLIWGESAAETSGRGTYRAPVTHFDRDYFTRISAKKTPAEMQEQAASNLRLDAFEPPSAEDLQDIGIYGIHLGDFIFWDDERQTEFVKSEYGWRDTHIEGTYKRYKSAECIMPGVHDFACYVKRGFGRATSQASIDVRAGLVTRDEAFEHLVPFEKEEPHALTYYLEITEQSREDFYRTLERHKHPLLKDVTLPISPPNPMSDRPVAFLDGLRKFLDQQGASSAS